MFRVETKDHEELFVLQNLIRVRRVLERTLPKYQASYHDVSPAGHLVMTCLRHRLGRCCGDQVAPFHSSALLVAPVRLLDAADNPGWPHGVSLLPFDISSGCVDPFLREKLPLSRRSGAPPSRGAEAPPTPRARS